MEFTGVCRWERIAGVGSVAQRLEQGTHNPLVLGSNPSGPSSWWEESIHRLWAGIGKTWVFFRERVERMGHHQGVRLFVLLLATVVTSWAEEENSAQRLKKAKQGMAEGTWPRKPDNHLSPLSGKMIDTPEISPKFYGQNKELQIKIWADQQKEAHSDGLKKWDLPKGLSWEEARWSRVKEAGESDLKSEKFQPKNEGKSPQLLSPRELSRDSAPESFLRSSRLGGQPDGSLRMYEGRLTHVRERVRQEEKNVRDLGPGRREKFSPDEAQKILSQPTGEWWGAVTEQSAKPAPPSVEDN